MKQGIFVTGFATILLLAGGTAVSGNGQYDITEETDQGGENALQEKDGAWHNSQFGFEMTIPPLWEGEVDGALIEPDASDDNWTMTFTHDDAGLLGKIHIYDGVEPETGDERHQLGVNDPYTFIFESAELEHAEGSEAFDTWTSAFEPLNGINELFSLTDQGEENALQEQDGAWHNSQFGFEMTIPPFGKEKLTGH